MSEENKTDKDKLLERCESCMLYHESGGFLENGEPDYADDFDYCIEDLIDYTKDVPYPKVCDKFYKKEQ